MAIDHESTESLDQALAYRIVRAARVLRVALAHFLEPFSVGPEQFFLLFRLYEQDGRQQGELVDPVLADRANISRLVAGLERDGLVERRVDPDDGRVRRVHLTLDGRTRITDILAVAPRERLRLFGALSSSQLEALDQALEHVESVAVQT